jgi:hypothetical protein
MIHKQKIYRFLFLLALSSSGLGDFFLGFNLYQNFVTIIILILGVFLLKKINFPKWLILLSLIIIFHTFVFNYPNIIFLDSLSHYIGFFVLLSITYSYLKVENLMKLLKAYYSLSYYLVLLGFLQILIFLFSGYSFLPQSIISGQDYIGYSKEIFNFFPRVSSVFSEPAHFTLFLLPSAYISSLQFLKKISISNQISTNKSIIILVGFFGTFSFVAFVMLIFSLIPALLRRNKINFRNLNLKKTFFYSVITIFIFLLFNSTIFSKITSFGNIINQSNTEITSSDFSGYAIVSNVYVAYNSFIDTNFIGSGFNTHSLNYDKYAGANFSGSLIKLNKDDAASLYIRFFSEFGFILFILLGVFLFKYKIPFNHSNYYYINNLSLMMILSYGIRNGSYISVFLLLFISLYYLSFVKFYSQSNNLN